MACTRPGTAWGRREPWQQGVAAPGARAGKRSRFSVSCPTVTMSTNALNRQQIYISDKHTDVCAGTWEATARNLTPHHDALSQGQALAAEMAQLRERAAASEARLAALQRERVAERAELEAARTALAEALEGLDGDGAKVQARRNKKVSVQADKHCHICLATHVCLHVCLRAVTRGLQS